MARPQSRLLVRRASVSRISRILLLIGVLLTNAAGGFAQEVEPGTYVWTNNKGTSNAGPGGMVATGTYVEISVFIAPTAKVLGSASVTGNSRIYGNAIVRGQASVEGDARIYGSAIVEGQATISDKAAVFGNAVISGNAVIKGTARVTGQSHVSSGTISNGVIDRKPSAAEIQAQNKAVADAELYRLAAEELYKRLAAPIGDLTARMVDELNRFPGVNKTTTHHRINYHFEKIDNCQILMRKSAIYDGGATIYGDDPGDVVNLRMTWIACLPGQSAMHVSDSNYDAIKFAAYGKVFVFGSGQYTFADPFSIIYQDGPTKLKGHAQLLESLQEYKASVAELYEKIPDELKSRIGT